MNMANSALDRVMDQAAQASENFSPPTLNPAPAGNSVAPAASNALAKPSLAGFAEQAGIQVDEYLRMDKSGFQLGEMKKKTFDEMIVVLDMRKVVPIYSARGEAGGNTKFLKSYDGVTTPQGQNFQQAVAHLEATTKCTGIYPTAEIPVILVTPVEADGITVKEGTRVGITPSLTAFSEFQKFLAELTDQGLENSKLKVKVAHKQRENRNGNLWGVATFELLEDMSSSIEG
jgi:hypothetical protein